MGRLHALILLALAACAPDQQAIGVTAWTLDSLDIGVGGNIGPSGQVARTDGLSVELRAIDGIQLLRYTCDNGCSDYVDIDHVGNVFVLEKRPETGRFTVTKVSVDGGDVLWQHDLAARSLVNSVVLDALGDLWVVFGNAEGTSDFGGGAVGSGDLDTHFVKLATDDGRYLASGALGAPTYNAPEPLAGGGLAFPQTGALVAIDGAGAPAWRIDRRFAHVATHGDGELTVVETKSFDPPVAELVRFDAERVERWRRPVSSPISLTPLSDGGVMIAGTDALGDSSDADLYFIEHVDRFGTSRRETFRSRLSIYEGAATDRFAFFLIQDGEGVDLHDRFINIFKDGVVVQRIAP